MERDNGGHVEWYSRITPGAGDTLIRTQGKHIAISNNKQPHVPCTAEDTQTDEQTEAAIAVVTAEVMGSKVEQTHDHHHLLRAKKRLFLFDFEISGLLLYMWAYQDDSS